MIDLFAIIKERAPLPIAGLTHFYSIFKLVRSQNDLWWREYLGHPLRFDTLEAAQEKYPHAIYIGESDEWLSSYPFKEEHLGETS